MLGDGIDDARTRRSSIRSTTPTSYNDGAPWTSNYETEYYETGVGVLFDIDFFERTNLMLGGRYDKSRAENVDFGDTFNRDDGHAPRIRARSAPRTSTRAAATRMARGA